MRGWRRQGWVIAVLVMASTARAEPPDTLEQVEELARQARQAYNRGAYEQAIAYYLRAYRVEPAAALLYNVAYIYDRKLNEPELATQYYRRYLAAPDAEPEVVERVLARLERLKEKMRPVERLDASPEKPERPVEQPAPAPPKPAAPPPASGAGNAQRAIGWVAVGVGGAAIAAGAVLAGLAARDAAAFDSARTLSNKLDLRDRGRTEAVAADVLFGTGLGVAAAGVVLLLTAPDVAVDSGVEVGWWPSPGGGGVTLRGVW